MRRALPAEVSVPKTSAGFSFGDLAQHLADPLHGLSHILMGVEG